MGKAGKIILITLAVFFLLMVVGVGLLFQWGKGKLADFSGESIVGHIQDAAKKEGFDVSFDEEGFSISGEDGEDHFSIHDGGDAEIKDDVNGIPLPDVMLVQVMEQKDGSGFFIAAYAIEDGGRVEEIKSDYKNKLERDGWIIDNEAFMEEAHFLGFVKDDGSYLSVHLTENELMISYDPPRN